MRLTLMLALILLPLVCFAVPTGLNLMPTAEALSLGQLRADYESQGSGKLYVPSGSTLAGAQVGAILGVEAGIDKVSQAGTVYNVKWVFKGEGLVTPALAVGAQNVKSGEKAEYYLVATKSVLPKDMAKVHAGVLRDTNGDTVTMVGASAKLGPLVLKADRINGSFRDGQAYSVGFDILGTTVTGTRYDFDNAEHENTLTLTYTYKAF